MFSRCLLKALWQRQFSLFRRHIPKIPLLIFVHILTRFTPTLLKWYEANGRAHLPWRNITDPYAIWVSEVILQQTQVVQGHDYYLRFIQNFPTHKHLAAAQEDEVLRLWQGLGYYSRARNMHAAAKSLADKDEFPHTYEEIHSLKGIGEYTAAAICSFAYNQPYAVVDGNVYRVLARYFGISTPIDTSAGKKEFSLLANELLDRRNSAIYNSAIMDFGAIQCRPKSPECTLCPLCETCVAYQEKKVEELPVKSKKVTIKERHFTYFVIVHSDTIFLQKRSAGDIWQGLYEPLLLTSNKKNDYIVATKHIQKYFKGQKFSISLIAEGVKHILTHQRLIIDFYQVDFSKSPKIAKDQFIAINKEELHNYGMPQVVKKILFKHLGIT